MLVLNLPTFQNKKCTADDRFDGNGPYDGIVTKKEPIRTLGFTLPYNNVCYYPQAAQTQHLTLDLIDIVWKIPFTGPQ